MDVSYLKTCLMWVTEPPEVGTTRQSSYFSLFGEEWYIKLSFTLHRREGYDVYVYLFSRNGRKNTKKGVFASCHLLAGKQVFGDFERFSVLKSGRELSSFWIAFQEFETVTSQRWKVCCGISSEHLSIQINNETILLSTSQFPKAPDPSVQTSAEISPDLQRLSDDFSRLLDKKIIPDAKLTCCGRSWNVHRSILTARSEVFSAMFDSGMVESESGAVRIEDLEAPVLDSLLKYVYSGKVPDVSAQNVSSLYEAADRYALHSLREACFNWMAKKLSNENCLGFLVIADAHGDAHLKESVVSFITEHFAQIDRAVWADFRKEHALLAIEVLERFAPLM